MKNKFLGLSLILFLILASCGTPDNPIEEIDFDMDFIELNLEEKTARFSVEGYPNETEFEQIANVIVDSLDAENVSDKIDVSVYSDQQVSDSDPFFGTAVYEDGELVENNLDQNSEENYLDITTT